MAWDAEIHHSSREERRNPPFVKERRTPLFLTQPIPSPYPHSRLLGAAERASQRFASVPGTIE